MHHSNQSPFSDLYAPIPDTEAYLRRIGFTGTAEVSLACLTELMTCHLRSVSFENPDVFHGHQEPALGTDALFQKIVRERRGGYCFELNAMFQRLLAALGFTCWSSAARIALGHDYLTPQAHQIVLVDFDERLYFCDVGYGGSVPASPVEIRYEETIQCSAGRRYWFSLSGTATTLFLERDGTFLPMLVFSELPNDPVDFVPLNTYCSHSPLEPFLHRQMVWCRTAAGRRSIDRDLLRIEQNGVVTETRLASDEALAEALQEHFGICYPHPLRNWH